jgi:hypothetical protein
MAELDDARKGVPVLLERCLELGARVLGLSVDPTFGHCVDAPVAVDLDRTPAKLLKRFTGGHRIVTKS